MPLLLEPPVRQVPIEEQAVSNGHESGEKKGKKEPGKNNGCMVLMPLEAYWSETLWGHIDHTLQGLGLDCQRASTLFEKQTLDENWSMLKACPWLIADLTYKHPSVFYYLGVAHSYGKRIILISQHERDIPIDFHSFPHIVYNNNVPGLQFLSEELAKAIKKIDGK